jgi:uncharacterized protein (TIGR02453 family)
VSTFPGFSDRALGFYADLANDNTKEFWTEHKAVYEAEVRGPMRALAAALEPEFGPLTIFRPYRDTRFSKDKSPYKTYQGAFAGVSPGIGYYLQLDSRGLLAGGGFRAHGSDQVARYRDAVDADETGDVLNGIVTQMREAGFAFEGEQLKTRPRGYDANHTRIDLLRYKSLTAVKTLGTPAWLSGPDAFDEVRHTWLQVVPLSEWVLANVEPA